MDLNRRLIYAAGEFEIGREGIGIICDILSMPKPKSSEAWKGHIKAL